MQRCKPCAQHYFIPRPFCPYCGSRDVEWTDMSGRATLASYVISRRAAPGIAEPPFVLALVELEEGPRMMTWLVDVPDDHRGIELGAALKVDFHPSGEWKLPVFRMEAAA
jgi:uncharacterized OB-fold protein